MNTAVGHFSEDKIGYFIDDVILAAIRPQEMLELLQEILETLIENNLTVETSKLPICKEEIDFLGFKVSEYFYALSD